MSPVDGSIAPVATSPKGHYRPPADNGEAAPVDQAAASEPGTERAIDGDSGGRDTSPAANADEDSEAETLIQSPEKSRNVVDGAPRLDPQIEESDREGESHSRTGASPSDGKIRKRKRNGLDTQDTGSPNGGASSRRSSSLSSPVPDAKLDDSDSDISSPANRTYAEILDGRKRDASDENGLQGPEEKRARTSDQPKIRRRRPSDIPTQDLQHRLTRQRQSLDASSNQDRRETRSATYPRQSSNDQSLSPEPVPRREHRRVASTQVVSSIALTKKRRIPAPLITTSSSRRDQFSDRHSLSSDDSTSPAPSRPNLYKIASNDNDAMSPAKNVTGPRKFRDKNGRTFLARACSNNDLESARARYDERPHDLNVADNAGNTPLQIASLEGYIDIVEFLLQKNCEVDSKNIDKETPLIDAVENGHVEVVKLLLKYGANPRQGNAKGDEPYELVQHEDENSYQEIRKLITEAKSSDTRRRKSDDQDMLQREGSSRAASAASPRDSPPLLGPRSPPTLNSRRRTGRSDFTRNDLLWQANTQQNLTKLAGRGDSQGVASILNILQKAETESLIAAAKGGHDEVLQYLLGMGDPDPDPDPVRSENQKAGYNTPMLAAIGRGKPAVIKLLVAQSGFNPTREHRGRSYPEISQERKGVNWEEEHSILKTAYENYKGPKARKHGSPRKSRQTDKGARRQGLLSSSPISSQRKSLRSPEQSHKDYPGKPNSMMREMTHEVKRESSGQSRMSDDPKSKGRDSNSGDHNVAVSSDYDNNGQQHKTHKTRRSHSDLHSADFDIAMKRRRLITGKEHRRRASVAGADQASDDEASIIVKPDGKLKPTKRPRDSRSSERPRSGESDVIRLTVKKRRTVQDSSPEETRSTKTSTVATEKFGRESSRGLMRKSPANIEDTAKMLGEVDENFKRSQHSRPETSEARPRRGSVQLMEGIEPTVVTNISDEDHAAAEKRAKVKAESDTAAEAELLAKQQEADRLQAEQDAADLAVRQAEEDKLAEEQKRADEAAAKKKAEEDAIARKRDEEERLEKIKRDAEERQRRQEERRQRESLEIERRRQDALPSRLRRSAIMLDSDDSEARGHVWLSKFLPLLTVRSSQIIPGLEHLKRGIWEGMHPDDEEWIPNFQVAYLLATKDLNLRSYTSLERRHVTYREKEGLWKVSRIMLSFDYHAHAYNTTIEIAKQKELEERPKFMAMQEIFWVKVS